MRLRASPSAASSRITSTRLYLGNIQAVLSGDFSLDDDNRKGEGPVALHTERDRKPTLPGETAGGEVGWVDSGEVIIFGVQIYYEPIID
jgi:hypothetical protein